MSISSEVVDFLVCNKYYIPIAIVTLYIFKGYYDGYQRLRAFKGPWAANFTDLWFAKATFGDSQHLVLANVCEKYGKIARLGPNTLVTTSPELWMRMSAVRSPYRKSSWYTAVQFPPGQDNIFSQQDEEKHTKRRGQMAEGYAGKTNPTLEPAIALHVKNFVDLVRRKYVSTEGEFKPLDMGRKAAYFTMDVITDIAFGQSFGNLVKDEDSYSYIEFTEDMLPVMMKLTALPALRALFQSRFGALMFPSDKSEKGVGKLMGIAKQLASKRFLAKDTNIRQDMLSSFIAHGLTENDLVTESVLQIIAGADTTATAIRSIFLHVTTNPRVYLTLQAEIDAAAKNQGLDGEEVVSDAVARELPYLQAVIKESLRIWPPVTGQLSKLSPTGGDSFTLASGEEVHIPGGVNIGGASWGLMRDKEVFGVDAEVFRPERWLEQQDGGDMVKEEQERIANMGKVLDLGFGYGKYKCLGSNVAWLEMNKVTFELLRRFEWEIVRPDRPWNSVNMGLWLQSEMWMRASDRGGGSEGGAGLGEEMAELRS